MKQGERYCLDVFVNHCVPIVPDPKRTFKSSELIGHTTSQKPLDHAPPPEAIAYNIYNVELPHKQMQNVHLKSFKVVQSTFPYTTVSVKSQTSCAMVSTVPGTGDLVSCCQDLPGAPRESRGWLGSLEIHTVRHGLMFVSCIVPYISHILMILHVFILISISVWLNVCVCVHVRMQQ